MPGMRASKQTGAEALPSPMLMVLTSHSLVQNHPPLNLVDLPGLIPNTGEATSSEVEKMVKDTLQVTAAAA